MAVSLSSISATSGTLTASGVGSGIDVKGLVSQLMAVEQRPLTILAQQEADFQSKLTSLGTVKSAFSSFQTAGSALTTAAEAHATSVSDSTVLSATAGSSAVSGNYSVIVTKLAQAQKLVAPTGRSSLATVIGAGGTTTLTMTLGTITGTPVAGQYASAGFAADGTKTPVSIDITSENNTLPGIRDAINAANAGITASIINDGSNLPYRLAFTTNATGASSSMKLSVSGDAALQALLEYDPTAASQNFNETQTAQNAVLSVDGVGITSTTNYVSDAVQGVTLNLTKESVGAITVGVQRDFSKLSSALSGLVTAYNTANKAVATATAKEAILQGDWSVLGLQRQVRSILGSEQTAGGTYTTLSRLGVRFLKDGTLTFDSSKLTSALTTDASSVSKLVKTFGTALTDATDSLLGLTGPITNKTAGINRSIKDIGTRRTTIQARLVATQARYQAQFNALDTLMSKMTQTSTFLTQQLNNLPNYYNQG